MASKEDSEDFNIANADRLDARTAEQLSEIKQNQPPEQTRSEFHCDRPNAPDFPAAAVSDLGNGGDNESKPSNSDDARPVHETLESSTLDLTGHGHVILPRPVENPKSALSLLPPAQSGWTSTIEVGTIPSAFDDSERTLDFAMRAESDPFKDERHGSILSAGDDSEVRKSSTFGDRTFPGHANKLPIIFYGPNRITQSSAAQDVDFVQGTSKVVSYIDDSKSLKQGAQLEFQPEDHKELSSKIVSEGNIQNSRERSVSFKASSVDTSEANQPPRFSLPSPDSNILIGRNKSASFSNVEIKINKGSDVQGAVSRQLDYDSGEKSTLPSSGTSSDDACRPDKHASTSSNNLAPGVWHLDVDSSDPLNEPNNGYHQTLSASDLASSNLQFPKGEKCAPLYLSTSISASVGGDKPPAPQKHPPFSYVRSNSFENLEHKDSASPCISAPVPASIEFSSQSSPQRAPQSPPRGSGFSSPASHLPPTPNSVVIGTDLHSISSKRDSPITDTTSYASSSELPEVNTADSIHYSTADTAATSQGIAPTLGLREQGQIQLRHLQIQLAAAKARGDSQSQEEAIQKSIEVIWHTHLSPPAEPVATELIKPKSPNSKLRNRASRLRFPVLTSSAKGVALGQAAADGDESTLTKLLDENVNINCTSADSKTPMMRAASNGRIQCLSILKTFGADELAIDKTGATALHHAVMANQPAAVKWFLETYAPPTSDTVRHRSSIISRAADSTKWGRANRNVREASDCTGSRPLHVAVECDKGGVVKILLTAGVDVEAKNNDGRTPLFQAIIASRYDSFHTLLRAGVRIDHIDAMGKSALHWAARLGHVAMVITLLEKGAGRWDCDKAGQQPIHEAVTGGRIAAVEALLTERSDLDSLTKYKESKNGESLLHIASLHNRLDLAQYLLQNGVNVTPWSDRFALWSNYPRDKLIGSSLTPLHYACCLGHFEMATLLLDHGALVNAPTTDGYTPLMMAVEAENTDLVALLRSRGANVNASVPGTLATALHMASRRGDIETVRELCRAGANFRAVTGKDHYRRTPLQDCCECLDKQKRDAVRQYLSLLHHNYAVRHGLSPTDSNHFYHQQQQQMSLVQQPRNVSYTPDSTPPPPYSKAPPEWG